MDNLNFPAFLKKLSKCRSMVIFDFSRHFIQTQNSRKVLKKLKIWIFPPFFKSFLNVEVWKFWLSPLFYSKSNIRGNAYNIGKFEFSRLFIQKQNLRKDLKKYEKFSRLFQKLSKCRWMEILIKKISRDSTVFENHKKVALEAKRATFTFGVYMS